VPSFVTAQVLVAISTTSPGHSNQPNFVGYFRLQFLLLRKFYKSG